MTDRCSLIHTVYVLLMVPTLRQVGWHRKGFGQRVWGELQLTRPTKVAHHEPMSLDAVATASRAHHRATASADRTREQLHAAILEAIAAGVSQADLARATGYTRERLRQLARAAGHHA